MAQGEPPLPPRRAYCGETDQVRLAWAGRHFGEEPPLTVWGGSGAIFFTGCALRCSFCQNHQISQEGMGRAVEREEFCRICLALQDEGAENINLVTAGHHASQVADYLRFARRQGLTLPIVWNTSAFESIDTLRLLADVVDVWLPDLKTLRSDVARRLFAAPSYPSVAKTAIEWMVAHAPLQVHEVARGDQVREKVTSGVIIRHLALPGLIDDTIETLQWIKDRVGDRAAVSLMSQYCPVPTACTTTCRLEERTLNEAELEVLDDLVAAFDFALLYKQEATSSTPALLPDFAKASSFPPSLAAPVWHWRVGFITQQP